MPRACENSRRMASRDAWPPVLAAADKDAWPQFRGASPEMGIAALFAVGLGYGLGRFSAPISMWKHFGLESRTRSERRWLEIPAKSGSTAGE